MVQRSATVAGELPSRSGEACSEACKPVAERGCKPRSAKKSPLEDPDRFRTAAPSPSRASSRSSDTSSSTGWTRAAALSSVCPQAVASAVVDAALALRCRRLDPGLQRRNSGIIRRAINRRLRVTPLPPHTRRSQAVRGQRRPSVGAGGGAAARHGCKGGASTDARAAAALPRQPPLRLWWRGDFRPRLDIIPTSRLAPSHHDRRSTSPPRPHYLLLCTNSRLQCCADHNIIHVTGIDSGCVHIPNLRKLRNH